MNKRELVDMLEKFPDDYQVVMEHNGYDSDDCPVVHNVQVCVMVFNGRECVHLGVYSPEVENGSPKRKVILLEG